MYIWIIKRAKILAYLGDISVALYMEEIIVELPVKEISVTPRVANFQGYVNSHFVCSYNSTCKTLIVKHQVKQSTNKKQTRKCLF